MEGEEGRWRETRGDLLPQYPVRREIARRIDLRDVLDRRLLLDARRHEGRVRRDDHALLVGEPEGVGQLAAHAAVERGRELLGRRDRGQLADAVADVAHRARVREAHVAGEARAVLAAQVGDLAQEAVDDVVRRPRVEAHGEDLVEGEERLGGDPGPGVDFPGLCRKVGEGLLLAEMRALLRGEVNAVALELAPPRALSTN